MSAKRSACDRCHRMKMQCQTEGGGQHCNRCRTANLRCNYSKPGKPGRPSTKAGRATNQGGAAEPEQTGGVVSPANRPIAHDDTWRQITPSEHATPSGVEYFLEEQQTSGSQYAVSNGFSDAACLQLNYMDWLGPLTGSSNITEAGECPSDMARYYQLTHGDILGGMGGSVDPKPHAPIFKENTMNSVEQVYMQHLAHFQVTIARMIDSDVYLGPAKLEQEAAHVLESSSKFLELIQALANVGEPGNSSHLASWFPYNCAERHRCMGPQESSRFKPAVFLQFTSISMRLLEMHHWLYLSIYRCLQQVPNTTNHETFSNDDKPQPLLFAIAGVRLNPTPHFWLQMLLHTGVYHLGRIQKTLNELGAFTLEAPSEGSPSLPLQTRMLISEDQKGRMAKIRSVLARLEEEFGIFTKL